MGGTVSQVSPLLPPVAPSANCFLVSGLAAAQAALQLVNGFRLQGKPLVIEFGHQKAQPGISNSEPLPGPGNPAVNLEQEGAA